MQRSAKNYARVVGSAGSQKRGTLHNQYLNKSCYFQNKQGIFLNPKSEETFIQETMFYINLDLFQQTGLKIIPWFHLIEIVNYQDVGLILLLAIAYITGYTLKKKKRHHLQRFLIMIVIFFELMIIQFMLLDKDLVDLPLWQIFGQIGIVIQNSLIIASPIQSFIISFVENFFLKLMILCRGKEQIFDCKQVASYQSYCKIQNLYEVTLNDFIVYPLLTVVMSYIINRIVRKYWIFINSFQKSDKCNSHLSQKNMTTFFIIDQHMQFVFYNEKGQQFIKSCEDENEPRITNFSQLFKCKEQQSGLQTRDKNTKDKIALFQEKIHEVIQQDKEIEIEMWLDENFGRELNQNLTSNYTEESIFDQIETVGLTQNENNQKVFYIIQMGPIMWKNSKMIQVLLEKQKKVSDIVQINEYFHDLIFKNLSETISQLEKDYLKWYNMVSLNVIKNDDLKELSKCINEYHQQYIHLYSIRKLNNEFHRIDQKNLNEFNIKANIIQAVEIVLVKKLHLVNQIKVQFEGSFPSHEVLADDILFHHPVEIKPEQKQIDSQSFKNSPQINAEGLQPRQVAEPVYKKFDFKVDCQLKQIRRNEILDLSFIFEFHCFPETERLLQKVFKKVRNMDVNQFIQPSDLLDQGKDYVNLFLIFLQLKRQDGEFELEKKQYHDGIINDMHRDSNDEIQTETECNPKSGNNTNVYLLTISLSVQPVSMQTFPGKYNGGGETMQKARLGNNSASVVSQSMSQKSQQKNSIRCPAPLNLSFARDPKINIQKNSFVWQYSDGKEAKKTNFDKTRKKTTQMSNKIFGNQQSNRINNKLPTNKDIDQSQSSSQQNIPPGQQCMNNQMGPNNKGQPQITNQSSGSNLAHKKEGEDITVSINLQNPGSQGQISQNPISLPIQSLSQQNSLYHRESIRKQSVQQSDIMNIQKMFASSPKQAPLNPSIHSNKGRRRTSIVGGYPQQKSFQDEVNMAPINKVRSLSRQVSQQIKEEVNTSEEEEKKDLFLSEHKQSSTNTQYKMPSSQRKIPENPSLSLSGQRSQSQNSQTSFGQNAQKSVQIQCPSEQKIGNNSKQHSGDRIANPTKSAYENDDFVKINEFNCEYILQESENEEQQRAIKLIQKQIEETLKLYKPLFVQDASLVIKQIINHSKAFDGQEINIIQGKDPLKNSPFLLHTQSTSTTANTTCGDESDTSQPNSQHRRKINRGNGRIRKNTSILDKFSGVSSNAGHQIRKSFKLKMGQQQFNDSPQMMELFMQHGESGAPSRVSRDFDTVLGGMPSQTQMTQSIISSRGDQNTQKYTQADATQHLIKDGIDMNVDCIQSADEDSRTDIQMYDQNDRKRASTYDIPYFYQGYSNIDIIISTQLSNEVNESRRKTHKRQWLTDDLWRKQHYSRSQTILVNTNKSQIVSQLKQMSQMTKGFQDCKHVRYTLGLVKEYQQMIDNCNLFLFILIDFQEQPEKAENILQQTAATIRECEERMGVPKTYIIGYVDFEQQTEFINKNYDKLDFWINHENDLNQQTLIEYVNQIKKKEIA